MKARFFLAALTLLTVFSEPLPARAQVEDFERFARAGELIVGLDFEEARKELLAMRRESPLSALGLGQLALYEGDCDRATTLLARPDIPRTPESETMADVARGCARVIAATVVTRDDSHAVEIRFQDEFDRPLAPLVVETVVKARDVLTRDLGVSWPRPTRITVVRDLVSLSAMTGLPYEAAQTTGTVAVAKWGRVTLLSPRASRHGYAWRDTLAHELAHLAITRASIDRAPLWLQEGLAKREEVRWREPGPFDRRPSPEAVVARGIELGLDLPLDKLGPSLAMLPSADAAFVAFAEVTSFVGHLAEVAPPDAIPKLLLNLRGKKGVDGSLVDATGLDLKGWDGKWRTFVSEKKGDERVSTLFGLGSGDEKGIREQRERMRLAELLLGRGHPQMAALELAKVTSREASFDPSLRYLRGRALEEEARATGSTVRLETEGPPLVAEPKEVAASFGPWWALRGRWARARGAAELADGAFLEAVAVDPFDVEAACQTLEPTATPGTPELAQLCEAARKIGEPPLGRD